MSAYSSSKLSLKDSFEEDEISDDVEDEVFIRDGRNGFKVDEEIGVKRPLMAPRRKCKNHSNFHPELCKRSRCKKCCAPYCYVIVAIISFLGLILAVITVLNFFPIPLEKITHWSTKSGNNQVSIVPCTDFSKHSVWTTSFPKLKSETAITSADLNQDTIHDFIIGYATGVDERAMPDACKHFNTSNGVCGGGAVAINGKTGAVLWQHWTRKDVLFVDCGANVNADKTKDCLLSGKGGVLSTVDGRTGALVWELTKAPTVMQVDAYSAQYVADVDKDGFPDVLVAHTSDQSGHVLLLNGRNGEVIGQIETPNKESVFTVPRITVKEDGSYVVIFATGTMDSPGSLYAIPLHNLALSDVSKCINIWNDKVGVSSGIVLADMNSDGMEDIIITSGDKLSVISGTNFTGLWNITTGSPSNPMQILTGPTPAYFDDDFTPDLLVTHMIGPSFPTYYSSQTLVSNGKGGANLLDCPIIGAGDVTAPGITLSYSGIGNDMYLYWLTTCNQPLLQTRPFTFTQGSTIHEQTHADLCRLRFNSSLEIQLYALNQHIQPPGILLYSSALNWDLEHSNVDSVTLKPEVSSQEQWPASRASSFRHKTQQLPVHYQYPSHTADGNPPVNYPRFQHPPHLPNQEWEPQPVSYNDQLMGFPAVNLGQDYDPLYTQESENNEDPSTPLEEGRDERANIDSRQYRERMKRSNYPKNASLPRATSTAILATPLDGEGIDIVFSTYWETPSSTVRILTELDQQCVQNKISAAQASPNKLNTLEVEVLQDTAERECLGPVGESVLDSINVGQLTVYRVKLLCQCKHLKPGLEECAVPLPLKQQSYSHRAGDVYFKIRPKV